MPYALTSRDWRLPGRVPALGPGEPLPNPSAAAVPGATERPSLLADTEYLPFTVRVVQDLPALHKAISIRHAAYARHLEPPVVQALQAPEALDTAPGVAVLLAESKVDGSALGSLRIQTNAHQPLMLERSIDLPTWMQGQPLAEATRLGVTADKSGRLIKTLLFKAYYQYCLKQGVRYMVITARSPLDRQYERLEFTDVYPDMGFVPLQHVFGLPHRVMYLGVQGARQLWEARDHPLLGFMCRTRHPDIRI